MPQNRLGSIDRTGLDSWGPAMLGNIHHIREEHVRVRVTLVPRFRHSPFKEGYTHFQCTMHVT